MRNLYLAVALCVASTSFAGVTSVDAVQVDNVIDGFVTNDIVIDFEGNLRGQQMIVALTAGSIYQDAVGADTAPNGAFFPLAPTVEFDSFVTIGGLDSASSEAVLVIGGAPNLPGSAERQFDTAGVNLAWAPGTGVDVPQGVAFPTARLTLSDDAIGEVWYFGSTSGTDEPLVAAPGGNFPIGTISGGVVTFIPEPSTALLAGLALVGFVARRK